MFEEIRRKDRILNQDDSYKLLLEGEYGFLALGDDKDACGYGVPISYVLVDNEIFFHCAKDGKKIDIIKDGKNATFCVVGKTKVIPENFTTKYESAMAFGWLSVCDNQEKIRWALDCLVKKYCPNFIEKSKMYIDSSIKRTAICSLKIKGISGKSKR